MAKQAGYGVTTLEVDDSGGTARDIKNDITSAQFAITRETQDVTGLDSSSIERLLLLGDASCTLDGVGNFTANQSHDTLSSVATGNDARTVNFVLSANTLAMEMLLTNYNVSRPQDGSLTWQSGLVLADGTNPAWS